MGLYLTHYRGRARDAPVASDERRGPGTDLRKPKTPRNENSATPTRRATWSRARRSTPGSSCPARRLVFAMMAAPTSASLVDTARASCSQSAEQFEVGSAGPGPVLEQSRRLHPDGGAAALGRAGGLRHCRQSGAAPAAAVARAAEAEIQQDQPDRGRQAPVRRRCAGQFRQGADQARRGVGRAVVRARARAGQHGDP